MSAASREKLTNKDKEVNNPCFKEQELSYKCLNDNDFDREKCELHFHNYNNCKEFWNKIRLRRKGEGIYPNIPPIEERAEIKKEYFDKFRRTE